jgi:hypothetical protein
MIYGHLAESMTMMVLDTSLVKQDSLLSGHVPQTKEVRMADGPSTVQQHDHLRFCFPNWPRGWTGREACPRSW